MEIKTKAGGSEREKLQPDITNSMRTLSKSSENFETVKAFTGIMLRKHCAAQRQPWRRHQLILWQLYSSLRNYYNIQIKLSWRVWFNCRKKGFD